jgi:hypothetical protein
MEYGPSAQLEVHAQEKLAQQLHAPRKLRNRKGGA